MLLWVSVTSAVFDHRSISREGFSLKGESVNGEGFDCVSAGRFWVTQFTNGWRLSTPAIVAAVTRLTPAFGTYSVVSVCSMGITCCSFVSLVFYRFVTLTVWLFTGMTFYLSMPVQLTVHFVCIRIYFLDDAASPLLRFINVFFVFLHPITIFRCVYRAVIPDSD